MITRRQILSGGAAWAAGSIAGLTMAAPTYPSRFVRIVVVNSAGGTDDAISRFVADRVSRELGQPVIVENRGGASGTIGAAYAAASPADGYTILCLVSAGIAQTVLREKLSYKLSSFVPIIGVGGFPLALAVSATAKPNITTFQEFTSAVRTGDGLTFASGGIGTMGHLTATRLLNALNGKGLHVVYRNNPDGMQALAGGFAQMMFASSSEVGALRSDGKVRVLAVASTQRAINMPDVPTFAELGLPDFNVSLWHGFVAPTGTPTDILGTLTTAIGHAVKDGAYLARFKPQAYQEDVKTGEALSAYIHDEATKWKKVIVDNKVRVE